ncbi:protein of unknown function [Streptomyces sp. KY75]|nr:protein of unknown function [Streptomyces sp. KY75]CAD5979635.1 protein of unknown function [Streptomyces sp. KY70]
MFTLIAAGRHTSIAVIFVLQKVMAKLVSSRPPPPSGLCLSTDDSYAIAVLQK